MSLANLNTLISLRKFTKELQVQLIIASRNVHKIRELRLMLKRYAFFDVLSLLDFPQYTPPFEKGKNLKENSIQKAVNASLQLNRWTLADTTELVVPILKNIPGIDSVNYLGGTATDGDNRKKLLEALRSILEPDRQAYFQCCIAISSPNGSIEKTSTGICEGTILFEERGSKGFGYDSIFMKYEYGKSFAELDETLKNRISHRRKAFDKLSVFLSGLAQSSKTLSPLI